MYYENHESHIIPCENHANHANHGNPRVTDENHKIMKLNEFYMRVKKIIKMF